MGRAMRRIGTGSATQRIELGGTFVPSSYEEVWSGEKYSVNDTFSIDNFDQNAKYLFVFRAFSGAGFINSFIVLGNQTQLQFTFWGDTTQFCRYRITKGAGSSGAFTINGDSAGTASNNALIKIYKI